MRIDYCLIDISLCIYIIIINEIIINEMVMMMMKMRIILLENLEYRVNLVSEFTMKSFSKFGTHTDTLTY